MDTFNTILLVLGGGTTLVVGISAGLHALLHKRDPRAQVMWAATSWFLPIFGPLFYWALGVNRIQTRARKWKQRGLFDGGQVSGVYDVAGIELDEAHPEIAENMRMLLQISRRVTGLPLLSENSVEVLHSGDEAYPAMLEAIEAATQYIYLCSYIFTADHEGKVFVDALIRAGKRGVDVRVLIDAIGSKAKRGYVGRLLKNQEGVQFERFLPPTLSKRLFRLNLRNHRKILVVDGRVGFTGGTNISAHNVVAKAPPGKAIEDLHFRLRGPIIHSMEDVFSEDWCFRVGETTWPSSGPHESSGVALCRGVKDGPNEDFEKLQWILIGALSVARESVKIFTPYFIPSRELLSALRGAVLRGARVEIILPRRSNLPYVDWAVEAYLPEVVSYGIHIYRRPAPFAHSKLLVVDNFYVNLGSANLDPRSLRLNFEFNVEVFEPELGRAMAAHFDAIKAKSVEVTEEMLAAKSLPVRIRNAAAKVFSPYL